MAEEAWGRVDWGNDSRDCANFAWMRVWSWHLGVARSRFKQRKEGNKWSWGMLKAEEKAWVRLGAAERGSGTGWARRAVATVRR